MYRNSWPLLALATYRKILEAATKSPATTAMSTATTNGTPQNGAFTSPFK